MRNRRKIRGERGTALIEEVLILLALILSVASLSTLGQSTLAGPFTEAADNLKPGGSEGITSPE